MATRFSDCKMVLRDPSSQVVLPNDVATFTCTVQTNGDFYVYINGQPVVSGDLLGITVEPGADEPNDIHTITIDITAIVEYNKTTVQCAVDQDGNPHFSATAYLWIASQPMLPNPVLSLYNATTFYIAWMEPFTHVSVAPILRYTVKMFDSLSLQWRVWTLPAPPSNTSFCHQVSISGDTILNCTDALYRNSENVSSGGGLQRFFVTKLSMQSDRNCSRVVFRVSASSVLGDSEWSRGISTTFPIAPVWGVGALVAETYLQPNGNRNLLLVVKHPPFLCPLQQVEYYLLRNNNTGRISVCNDSHPTVIKISNDMPIEDNDVLTLTVITMVGNASVSIKIPGHEEQTDWTPVALCPWISIYIMSILGLLTCCATFLCFISASMMWKSRQAVTPSVHVEQCNQFYDEAERNIYDQIEICKGMTFTYSINTPSGP